MESLGDRLLKYVQENYDVYIGKSYTASSVAIGIRSGGPVAYISSGQGDGYAAFRGCDNAIVLFQGMEGVVPCSRRYDWSWYKVLLTGQVPFWALCEAFDIAYWAGASPGSYSSETYLKKRLLKLVRSLTEKKEIDSKTYGDSTLDSFIPPPDPVPERIREMRSMFDSSDYLVRSESSIFVTVGRFMEDYTDDHPYGGSVSPDARTYSMLSDNQLRGYFTWRTKVRNGIISKAPPAYALIYLSELVNGIGWKTPADGLDMMAGFLRTYSKLDPGAVVRGPDWMCDFCACHNLPSSDIPVTEMQNLMLRLMSPETIPPGHIEKIMSAISDYSIFSKKTYRDRRPDLDSVVCRMLTDLDALLKTQYTDLAHFIFHQSVNAYYVMFPGLVYYGANDRQHYEYAIRGRANYKRDGRFWIKTTYTLPKSSVDTMDAFLKTLDSCLRDRWGLKPQVTPRLPVGGEYFRCVVRAIDEWTEERKVCKVSIDPENLRRIRTDAEDTMEKIMTSEERGVPEYGEDTKKTSSTIDPDDAVPNAVEENGPEDAEEIGTTDGGPADGPAALLTSDERRFLSLLLGNGPWREFLNEKHMAVTLVVDSVNGKLYDEFGDTVLEFVGNELRPVEDYRDELEAMLRQ